MVLMDVVWRVCVSLVVPTLLGCAYHLRALAPRRRRWRTSCTRKPPWCSVRAARGDSLPGERVPTCTHSTYLIEIPRRRTFHLETRRLSEISNRTRQSQLFSEGIHAMNSGKSKSQLIVAGDSQGGGGGRAFRHMLCGCGGGAHGLGDQPDRH